MESTQEQQLGKVREQLEEQGKVIEYKQAIWNQFENQLSKALKKDSALYKQIQATTNILLEGDRKGSKLTNVISDNQRLNADHQHALDVANRLLYQIENEISKLSSIQSPQKGTQKAIFTKSLSAMLEQVENYLHQLTVKVSELNEENCHFRDEYQKMQSQNANLNKRILFFTEKIKLYQESVTGGSSSEQPVTPELSPAKLSGFSIKLVPTSLQTKETPRILDSERSSGGLRLQSTKEGVLHEVHLNFNQQVIPSSSSQQQLNTGRKSNVTASSTSSLRNLQNQIPKPMTL